MSMTFAYSVSFVRGSSLRSFVVRATSCDSRPMTEFREQAIALGWQELAEREIGLSEWSLVSCGLLFSVPTQPFA